MSQSIGETLREAIRQSGRPVLAIAKQSGIPQPVLCDFVNEKAGIHLRTADKLAKHFGLVVVRRTNYTVRAPQRNRAL